MSAHLRRVADYWSRLAKQQGYPARSVFKLKEIDHKFKIFRPGMKVCDLGCSPGSWTMLSAETVGPTGSVLGLDTQPLPLTIPIPPHVKIMRQDVFDWKVPISLHSHFDVLLSDMAPSTSGIKLLDANSSHELCERTLNLADTILKPNGTLVMKIFQGAGMSTVMKDVHKRFAATHTFKPEATRDESVETFIIAKKKKWKSNYAGGEMPPATTINTTKLTQSRPAASPSSAPSPSVSSPSSSSPSSSSSSSATVRKVLHVSKK